MKHRFNSKEQRMIDNAVNAELKEQLRKRGLEWDDLSEEEQEGLTKAATDSAEAGFRDYVDQQIDEHKERKVFGDDET